MSFIALKMLMGDRAKYFGILLGITFTSLVMTQQSSIFAGIMSRTFGFISDTPLPDIWVMDRKVQFIDDIKPMQDTQLLRVRGVEGVDWAVPLYKGLIKARLKDGTFQSVNLIGVDDATLIAGPPQMLAGRLEDLRTTDAVIVDDVGASGKLAKPNPVPGGPPIPLQIGDSIELNDHRATVVGITKVNRTFQSQPVVYTTYTRATLFAPRERKLLSFVLVKADEGMDQDLLTARIREVTGLAAYRAEEFKELTIRYFLKNTGIPINFGIAVVLGFIVGTAVAGQTFYNFTLDNIRYFGALKAMGATHGTLLRMIVLQALLVGFIGYGIGVGLASVFGVLMSGTELAFRLMTPLLLLSGGAVILICILASLVSIWKVMRLDPAIVFKQ